MGFSLSGGRTVAEPRLVGIHSQQGMGVLQLRFSVEWTFFAAPFSGRVHSTAAVAWVHVDGTLERVKFGHAWPETSWWGETQQLSHTTGLMYELFFRPEQILALERIRNGRGLKFSLDLHGLVEATVEGRSYQYRGNASTERQLNAHDWAELVKSLGMCETVFIGLDLGIENGELSQLIRSAHSHLIDGRYDAAIGQCRVALEALHQQSGVGGESADSGKKPLRDQSLPERRIAISKGIRHFTHLAMHPVDGKRAVFSRDDAVLVVSATAAVVNAILADETVTNDRSKGDVT